MIKFFSFFLFGLLNLALQASPGLIIHVTVLQNQNYIVGAANAPTGLYRYEGDTLWTHLGWRNARNFGIAIEASNSDYIFLACGNGAFRSLDGGQSWRITTDWRVTEAQDVDMNPWKTEQVFIATPYGIWRTMDRGDTWISANDGLKSKFVQTIQIDRSSPDRLIAGGEDGLYESIDGANFWKKIGPADVAVRDVQQCSGAANFWIAGTEDKGVLLSTDGAKTWRFSKGDISHQTIYAAAIDPTDPRRMAAGGFQTGVFVSLDGGTKWSQYKKVLPVPDIHALAFDPEKSGRIWVGTLGAGVYYSDDLGRNWIYAGLRGADIWDMTIIEGEK